MNNYLLINKQHIIHFVNFIYTYNQGAALCLLVINIYAFIIIYLY